MSLFLANLQLYSKFFSPEICKYKFQRVFVFFLQSLMSENILVQFSYISNFNLEFYSSQICYLI